MRKMLLLGCVAGTLLMICSPAFAAAAGDIAWNEPVEGLAGNLQHTVVPYVLDILIAVSGLMILFGEQNNYKPILNIVLGCSMAAQVGLFLYALGFGELLNPTISPASAVPMPNIKITNDLGDFDLLSGFMNHFIQVVKAGSNVIMGYALKLAGLLIIIDWSISLSLGLVREDKIRFLLMQMLKIGFFVFLIKNWVDGTYGIAHMIVASFEKLGFLASGASSIYMPDSIVVNGINTFTAVWKTVSQLGMGSISVILADILLALTVIFTTFITAIEMFMARIEFWTIALITLPLLPFGLNRHTNFLAEKAIGAIFSLGIKVSVISFLTAVACPLMATFAEQIKTQAESSSSPLELSLLLQMVLASLLLCVLVHKIPNLAQGLISGSPSLVSGDLFDHAPSTGRLAAAGGAAYGTYQMATNMEGGGTAMASDRRTQNYNWLHKQASEAWGTAKNIISIENQRYNPFASASRQSQQEIQSMFTARAANQDIRDTARGKTDRIMEITAKDGRTVYQTDPATLYKAHGKGAVEADGIPIKNQKNEPMTHGWTPPPRAEGTMDANNRERLENINEKIENLYKRRNDE